MKTSTIHELMCAITDVLNGEDLGGHVVVASGPLGSDASPDEVMCLLGSPERIAETAGQTWATIGNRSREERYIVAGYITVARPGADEAAIRDARGRAFELFAVLERVLRADPSVLNVARTAEIGRYELGQWAEADRGRVCRIEFEIRVGQRLPTG